MKLFYLSFLLLVPFPGCKQAAKSPKTSQQPDSLQNQKNNDNSLVTPIVFKSADDGQTWQNVSKGLPENLPQDSIRGNNFFATDKGPFFTIGNERYRSTGSATPPFWSRDNSVSEHSNAPGAFYWGVNLKTKNGTSIWSPVFDNAQEPRIRSAFETAGGTIFIGTASGFFKTADTGKTWKRVHTGSLVGHLAELNGVLVAVSTGRIIRSADNGENWAFVTGKGSVAWDVKQVNGGFAAVASRSLAKVRSYCTSPDTGKTWWPVPAGNKVLLDSIRRNWNDRPRLQAFQTSIIPVGEKLFCMHPDGIFGSTDKGKTWTLLLPAVKDKVFNLFVSGNVIYAIAGKAGC